MEFQLAFVAGFVVLDRNFTVIVDPKLTNNNVMNRCGDFFVSVVVTGVLEFNMGIA